MNTIQDDILDRIRGQGRGKVFTPKDFLDLGSRAAADQSRSRLVKGGEIRRFGRGLYHFPRSNERLGIPVGPDLDEIAEALARQTGSRVVPSGAVAANRLGLSTQVPAKPVYLTDGRTRELKIGSTTFQLRHVAPKEFPVGCRGFFPVPEVVPGSSASRWTCIFVALIRLKNQDENHFRPCLRIVLVLASQGQFCP